MRFIKKVMERGTVTLPSDVREALDVREGDIVEFEIIGIVKKAPEATATPAPRARRDRLAGPASEPASS